MIHIKMFEGKRFVTFKCPSCHKSITPCISCKQERSVYELAFQDGLNGVEKIKVGFNPNHSSIFDLGYKHGSEER